MRPLEHLDARVGLLLVDSTTRVVVEANSSAARLLGTSVDELVGRPLRSSPGLGSDPEIRARLVDDWRPDEASWRCAVIVPSGSRHLDVTLVPVDVGTPLAHLLVELVDRTEEVRLRAELEHERRRATTALEGAMSRFVASVSHELRTPLASLLGATELLMDGTGGELSHRQLSLIGTVDRSGRRLGSLVLDLLALAHEDSGHFTLSREQVDLGEVVRDCVDSLAGRLDRHDVQLDVVEAPAPLVHGDRAKLAHAVGNLLCNAAKFTPAPGRISVSVATAGPECVLEVADTGPGVPADLQPVLFRRFARGSPPEGQTPGAGLGLTVAHGIVTAHGGTIAVKSAAGEGSVFTICLRSSASLDEGVTAV